MIDAEEFWRMICRYAPLYYLLLMVLTVMAVLNAFSILLAPQATGTFVVAMMVFVIIAVTAAGVAVVLWKCNQR